MGDEADENFWNASIALLSQASDSVETSMKPVEISDMFTLHTAAAFFASAWSFFSASRRAASAHSKVSTSLTLERRKRRSVKPSTV